MKQKDKLSCGHEDGHAGVVDGEDDGDVLLGWLLQAGVLEPCHWTLNFARLEVDWC